jgi:uncharacterized protein
VTPSPDAVFAPPGEAWQRVQPALARIRRLVHVAINLVLAVVCVVLALAFDAGWIAVVGLAVIAVDTVWGWLLIGRQVAAWGYAERDEDLLITSGVLFKRLVVVPYGRMQFVDVSAGPLERWVDVCSVQLHTASAESDATIPGLEPTEAAHLRDRLAERGKALAAGL